MHRLLPREQEDVHHVLQAVERLSAAAALAAASAQMGGNISASADEDEDSNNNEEEADRGEQVRMSAENLTKVLPFVPATGWIVIMPPDSPVELDDYVWTGK